MSNKALMGQEGTAMQPQNQLQIKVCAEEEGLHGENLWGNWLF